MTNTLEALIARNAELEAQRLILAKRLAGYHEENKALRRAFPKPRVRCCMNCAEHGECNMGPLTGCGYDQDDADYDRGWNACLDAALARATAKENDA